MKNIFLPTKRWILRASGGQVWSERKVMKPNNNQKEKQNFNKKLERKKKKNKVLELDQTFKIQK